MNGRDRRALTIGAMVVALALSALRLLPWAHASLSEARAEAGAQAERLARIRELVREAPELEDSAALVREKLAALAPRVLVGRKENEAQSDLSTRLAAAASNPRVRLLRTEPRADTVAAGVLHRVSIGAELEGDNAGVLELLAALARDSAALVVDEIQLTAGNPYAPRREPERLSAELVVRGWYMSEGDR